MGTLSAAFACAVMLTGLPGDGVPLPNWDQRAPTRAEQLHTNRIYGARALYNWKTKTIIAPSKDWAALVHEMVHYLEFAGGYRFSETRAETAERRAFECLR